MAGTAYSISASEAAAKAANAVKPKKFVPVDIPRTQAEAIAADTAGYAKSDADFKKRFPKLAQGRNFNIQSSLADRSGAMSAGVTDALGKAGLSADFGTNAFQQAKNLGMPILAKEQRDRTYFQRLLADNPQRQFGLSGQDIARISIANTGGTNNYNQGLFGSRMNMYNQQVAQNAQNNSAAITGLTGALGMIGQAYSGYQRNDPTNPDYYRQPFMTSGGYGDNG